MAIFEIVKKIFGQEVKTVSFAEFLLVLLYIELVKCYLF
jgi:hypothetical protein